MHIHLSSMSKWITIRQGYAFLAQSTAGCYGQRVKVTDDETYTAKWPGRPKEGRMYSIKVPWKKEGSVLASITP